MAGSTVPAHVCTAIWLTTVGGYLVLDGSFGGALPLAWSRVVSSALAAPRGLDWTAFAIALAALAFTALPFGVLSGFLAWPPRPPRDNPWKTCLFAVLQIFVTPGVSEELIFRVLPLPGRDEIQFKADSFNTYQIIRAIVVLIVFTVPFHLDTLHHRGPIHVFRDWRFLSIALLLGIACTAVFYASGSLWLAAATHGVPVWCWLCLFGGLENLSSDRKDTCQQETYPPEVDAASLLQRDIA